MSSSLLKVPVSSPIRHGSLDDTTQMNAVHIKTEIPDAATTFVPSPDPAIYSDETDSEVVAVEQLL